MALREFTDKSGGRWRVWDIAPEGLHPGTRREEYLQGFIDGWLVFETLDGEEKRRSYPIPAGWEEMDGPELERLLQSADPVRSRSQAGPEKARRVGSAPPARVFRYPGGTEWTVGELPVQPRSPDGSPIEGVRTVLRFTSGDRHLDLDAWPPDWHRLAEPELADLLWRAFPRPAGTDDETPHRRRGD